MKLRSSLLFVLLALLAGPRAPAQSRYAVGQTVANFTLTDRATGRPVQLADFAGKVVLLEWFAWWCPYCQAAADQIGPGIVRHYADRGGNAAGLPVLHVSLNLQPGQETETQKFIDAYKVGLILNDFDRALANRFQSGGQPIFAVINGVADSPSHRPWELVFSQLGYGSTQAPIADLRAAIDSVRAPAGESPTMSPSAPQPAAALAFISQPSPLVVRSGDPVSLTVTASGESPIGYQWFRDGVSLAGAIHPMFTLNAATASDAGHYTVRIAQGSNVLTSSPARLTVNPAPVGLTNRLSNLSVLTTLTPGQILTLGFTMQGGAKPVLLRAAGPSLGALGVPGTMADPRLALFDGTTSIATNDNWAGQAEVAAANLALGAFAFVSSSSLDAALVRNVEGGRSVQVSGPSPGTVIVEVYDAGTGPQPRLTNLSALHRLATDAPALTAGFTIAGTGTKTVLLRAVGPGLTPLGVPGALSDPTLMLYDSSQTKLAQNDDWPPGLARAFASVGAFGLEPGSRDAALLVTLAPGGYSAQIGTATNAQGHVLIEVYEVE